MQDYKNLKVWERAHQLTLAVYQATSIFPKDEMYGLTSQIRRACASVPANIAERLRTRWRCGVCSVFTYCDGVGKRARLSFIAGSGPETFECNYLPTT